MTNAKRGRGFHRGVDFCAAAALGLALSGCGGGAGSSAATALGTAATAQATSGQTASSLPPTASTGVTINWSPPTENTDGTPLTNLAGYDIHYGTAPQTYTKTIAVSNPGIATYVVDNLSPGTYYFTVTAVNSQGAESPMSSAVSATVN